MSGHGPPGRRSRPADHGPAEFAEKDITNTDAASVSQPIELAYARRRRWAAALIRKGRESGTVVIYGDEDWCRLPQDHPARIAAVVAAAECHAEDGDDIPRRLRAELDAVRQADELAEREAFGRMASDVRRTAGQVPLGEIALRRGDISAEQLVQWEADHRAFVCGRSDEPARLPRRQA